MMLHGTLTLDLGGRVGWAYGLLEHSAPEFGSWRLEGSEGQRYASLENELMRFCCGYLPREIVLEAPMPVAAMNNDFAAGQQLGLRAIAFSEGYRQRIPVTEVDCLTVRSLVLGWSRYRRGEVKEVVFAYCRDCGWEVPDHNAADAVMIWLWKRFREHGTPPPLKLSSLRGRSVSKALSARRSPASIVLASDVKGAAG
jgi:Holliday junction resolvasome RuvABC endonuclease subunit